MRDAATGDYTLPAAEKQHSNEEVLAHLKAKDVAAGKADSIDDLVGQGKAGTNRGADHGPKNRKRMTLHEKVMRDQKLVEMLQEEEEDFAAVSGLVGLLCCSPSLINLLAGEAVKALRKDARNAQRYPTSCSESCRWP